MKKTIITWIMTIFLVSSFALAGTMYPTPHYGSEAYSIIDNIDYEEVDSSGSFASFSDIQNHVILNYITESNDLYITTYSGRQIIFWGLEEGELVSKGDVTIGDSNDEIVGIVGKLNNPSLMSDTSAGLIVLTHDTVDNDVRAEEIQFSNTLGIIDGYTVQDLFMLISDTNTIPETMIDCDYYPDTNGDLQAFCAYGSTTNKIVSFSTHEPAKNNIISLDGKNLNIYNSDIYYGSSYKPTNMIASHGTSNEIYLLNNGGNEIIAVDISSCTGGDCNISSSNYIAFPEIKPHSLTGFDYSLYNPSASKDSGKVICYDTFTGSYLNGELNCIYNDNKILSVSSSRQLGDISRKGRENNNMFIYDVTNNGNIDICVNRHGYDGYDYRNEIACIDSVTETQNNIISERTDKDTSNRIILKGIGKINGSDEVSIIVYNYYEGKTKAYNQYGNESFNLSKLPQDTGKVYLSDLDNDGEQEIITMGSGSVSVNYKFSEEPQELIIDEGLNYAGLYGFYNPAQVNTDQYIKAKECDYSDNTKCTYTLSDTNVFNREKLCSDCGGTTETCGGWSYTEPYVTCNFNTTGEKTVNVELYSEKTPSTVLGSFTITNWQITSDNNTENHLIALQDPDIEDTTGDGADTGSTETPDGTTYATSFFSAIEDNIKPIIGIFFIIAVVASLASQGIRNHIVLMFAGILTTLVVSLLGLISIAFLIYILIAIISLIILNQTVFKSHGGE